METSYLSKVEKRIDVALKNKNTPPEAKWVFVGEIQASYMSGVTSLNELNRLIEKLGIGRKERFAVTDYVMFGSPQEDD